MQFNQVKNFIRKGFKVSYHIRPLTTFEKLIAPTGEGGKALSKEYKILGTKNVVNASVRQLWERDFGKEIYGTRLD